VFERSTFPIRNALRNMRQSPFLSTAAIGTIAVSLSILAFFVIVVLNIQGLTTRWTDEIQVVAYFDPPKRFGTVEEWIAEVERLASVEKVTYIDSSEAFKRFRKSLGDNADLLEGLDADFLPASFEIALKPEARNRQGVSSVVSTLRMNPSFSDLRYGSDWLERFEAFLSLIKTGGAILGGFLLLSALFIISNTIKLTLYARRDELEIMALVGATPFFIRAPFLLEGMIQGAIGGLLALCCTYLFYWVALKEGLTAILMTTGFERIIFLSSMQQLVLLGTGVFLGVVGSFLSLRKFARV